MSHFNGMRRFSCISSISVVCPRSWIDFRPFQSARAIPPRRSFRRSAVYCRRLETMEVDEDTRQRRAEEKQAAKEAGLVKRKVALHIGYTGTKYSGLQLSPLEQVTTIEGVLLSALSKSGCITESNSASLAKVKWSRSSRTDKGVHALSTVIAVKCLVDEKKFDNDPEGLELAEQISTCLPPEIQVFSVQRVNDGFFARKACQSRTYTYFLPVSVLIDSEEENEQEAMGRFRTALEMFCGRHAFHNYTKRRQYLESRDTWSYGRKKRKQASEPVLEESEDVESEDDLGEEGKSGASINDYKALIEKEKETGRWRFWKCEFKEEDDPTDHVVSAHYRQIRSFTAGDPVSLIPGGVRCVRCTVKGQSFMLHQIRHMIGTAVSFARRKISKQVLEGSLRACLRVNLPLAPPHPLVLQDNEFSEFPTHNGEPAVVSKWSGSRLDLREGGRRKQQEFSDSIMMPEINELLTLADWDKWSNMVSLITYDESVDEDVKSVIDQFDAWVKEKLEIKKAKELSLQQELKERGIDRATWMKERTDKKKKVEMKNRREQKSVSSKKPLT